MELALIFLLIGGVLGAAGGYLLAAHIHSVAAAVSSAVLRATTIPAGDVSAVNAKVDGLGNRLQTIASAVQTPAVAAVAAAQTAANNATKPGA
jgi:ABC-type lipoprotein release transport system permease subunit